MQSYEELLAVDDIKSWLESHAGSADAVRRAAENIYMRADAVTAMKKILPALSNREITVFFSFKKKDEEPARAVVERLRKYSAGKLNIIYQADFSGKITGKVWRSTIKEAIEKANWFILLLPDPSEDWDWCLYETGLFDRQLTSADRMICLHHPNSEIPGPITEYHHVPAIPHEVEEFLRMVYLKDDPIPGMAAINPAIADEISEIALEISDAIRQPAEHIVRRVFEPNVVISIPNASALQESDDLDAAQVLEANDEALELFDYRVSPKTWKELRAYVVETNNDRRWRDELFHVIRKIAGGRRHYPVQAVFQAHNGRYFRPAVHAVDKRKVDKEIVSFHLTFSEDICYIDGATIPTDIYRLAAVLRFAFRFRWEILEKYAAVDLTEDDVERVENAFRRLKKEWESRELGDKVQILDLFEGERRERVFDLFLDWDKARNRQGTGLLDKAFENRDGKAVSEVLEWYLPKNKEFLEIVTDRFAELIQNDYH